MGRKYYIQVDETCAEELARRGIGGDRMIVVEEDAAQAHGRHAPLLKAIAEVTGVDVGRIFSHESTRYAVLARTIYVHYARIDGDGVEQISRDLRRGRRGINYYLQDYYSKMEGDIEFRKADARIAAMLGQDDAWKPPKAEAPQRRRKRRGKRRRRTGRQPRVRKSNGKNTSGQVKQPVQLELF